MRSLLFIIGLSLLSTPGNAQSEISGVTPAKSINISGESIQFNGAGLREKFFLDLYVGSLYLSNKTKDASTIINANETMAITLDIVSGLISSEKRDFCCRRRIY